VSESESELTPSSENRTFTPPQGMPHEPFGERRDTPPPVKPPREGLPSTYRMRADAHYVDQLSGRSSTQTIHLLNAKTLTTASGGTPVPPEALVASIRRHNVLQPLLVQRHGGRYRIIDGQKRLAAAVAAGVDEVPCLLHDVEDSEAEVLSEAANVSGQGQATTPERASTPTFGDAVAQALGEVARAADLLSQSRGSLGRMAALNIINAEMWRAECLLDGSRLSDGKRRVTSGLASPVRIVEAVRRQMLAEARLRSTPVEARTSDVPAASLIYSDEELVVRALSLLTLSTLAWLEGVADARVTVRVAQRGNRSVAFEVFQDAVLVPSWFSTINSASDYVGDVPAAVWLLGARQIAEALNAQVSIAPAGGVGSIMGLTLPVAKE
jgi:ParB-like chromosome segregation protein Spo0J